MLNLLRGSGTTFSSPTLSLSMSVRASAGVAVFPLTLGAVYFLSVSRLVPDLPFGRGAF